MINTKQEEPTKICTACGKRKPLPAFGVRYGELGGHYNCIGCRRKKVSKYRLEALKVIANGKPIRCAKHDKWNCCADPTNLEYLSFDHIYGDGNKHRKKIKGGSGLVLWIRRNPEEASSRKEAEEVVMSGEFDDKEVKSEELTSQPEAFER